MSNATFQTMTLKPSDAADAIRAMMMSNVPLFNWGPPGIAKSAVAQQVASEEGIAFADIRLSQMDPTDLRGIPYPAVEHDVRGVSWSAPLVLPRNLDISTVSRAEYAEPITMSFPMLNPMGSNGIHYITNPEFKVISLTKGATAKILSSTLTSVEVALFVADEIVPGSVRINVKGKARAIIGLEEFNSAPESVVAAAYQLVLDRRLGEYIVPEGCWIMAMGNNEKDRGIAYRMGTAISNRYVHIEQRHDFDDWQLWALGAGIHPEVVGYLTAFKEQLFQFNPATASRGFPTPRSWEFVSKILTNNPNLRDTIALPLFIGAVGESAGASFNQHRKIAKDLPSAESILSGNLKKLANDVEVQLQVCLVTTLLYEIRERSNKVKENNGENWRKCEDREKWLTEADNFFEFVMNNCIPEVCILAGRTGIKVHALPFDHKRMAQLKVFTQKFKNLITQ